MKRILLSCFLFLTVLLTGCELFENVSSSISASTSTSEVATSSVVEVDEVLLEVNEVIDAFISNHASSYVNETTLDYVVVSILAHLDLLSEYADDTTLSSIVSKEVLESISTIGNAYKYSMILSAFNQDLTSYQDFDLVSKVVALNAIGSYQSLYGIMSLNNYHGEAVNDQETYISNALIDLTTASSPKNATVDSGGTTLIALAPYYQTNTTVKDVIDEYVNWVSEEEQTDTGEVKDVWMGENAATIAQVIMGLVANNIDPRSEAFTKTEGDLVTALLRYALEDGSFKYQISNETNDLMFSTPQAILALVVYKLYKESNQAVNAFMFN